MNVTNLRHQLLTVSFSISAWEARKQDRKATQEVAKNHGTDARVGRYHKDLLPDATEHEAILKLRNAWRVRHYELTLPWGDDGGRVIKSAAFLDYAADYRTYKQQWDEALEAFFAAYPSLVAKAEMRLNTLFNANDYPPVEKIKDRFDVRLTTYPLPDAQDFRIIDGIPPEEADRLIEEATAGINARLGEAIRDLWTRMHEVTANMQQRLAAPIGEKGGKFHDTLVTNVQDLLQLLPKLNVTNDPEIAKIGEEMKGLAAHEPQVLRENPEAREATRKRAEALAKRMAQYVQE